MRMGSTYKYFFRAPVLWLSLKARVYFEIVNLFAMDGPALAITYDVTFIYLQVHVKPKGEGFCRAIR
jgi:hypothetical protein